MKKITIKLINYYLYLRVSGSSGREISQYFDPGPFFSIHMGVLPDLEVKQYIYILKVHMGILLYHEVKQYIILYRVHKRFWGLTVQIYFIEFTRGSGV